jgi:hypothetical protein
LLFVRPEASHNKRLANPIPTKSTPLKLGAREHASNGTQQCLAQQIMSNA